MRLLLLQMHPNELNNCFIYLRRNKGRDEIWQGISSEQGSKDWWSLVEFGSPSRSPGRGWWEVRVFEDMWVEPLQHGRCGTASLLHPGSPLLPPSCPRFDSRAHVSGFWLPALISSSSRGSRMASELLSREATETLMRAVCVCVWALWCVCTCVCKHCAYICAREPECRHICAYVCAQIYAWIVCVCACEGQFHRRFPHTVAQGPVLRSATCLI